MRSQLPDPFVGQVVDEQWSAFSDFFPVFGKLLALFILLRIVVALVPRKSGIAFFNERER